MATDANEILGSARISAVLPAYNEQALIESTVTGVVQALANLSDDYEVLVVDDGSRDRTAQIVGEMAAKNPKIRCISHPQNKGYGEALRTGFSVATKELIFLTDGDGQFDPAEVAGFLPYLVAAELVVGYRTPRRDPPLRRLYGWGWALLVNLLFGYTARDIDCAFKLFRRAIWRRFTVRSGGATFSAELLVKARRCGYTIVERPVSHRPRLAGRPTGARPGVIIRAFWELLVLRLRLEPCRPPGD